MPRVYVVGASLPGGGNYIAYRLGCLLQRHFGYELFEGVVEEARGGFHYDVPIKSVSLTQMIDAATKDDLLVVNVAFSKYLFGLLLPARKICYVQGFQTFDALDCHFDLYVAVSSVVQRFLKAVYDITAPVIPPFIELDHMPAVKPWHERPQGSSLVYVKEFNLMHEILLKKLRKKFKELSLPVSLDNMLEGRGLSHTQFLKRIGAVRYIVNLTLAEGFGLIPLEAMAMGTMVTGLDSLAGRDYMNHGENCLVSSVTDLHTLSKVVRQAFTDEAMAAKCAAGGKLTAEIYGYEPFKRAWLNELSAFLKKAPAPA